MTPVPGEELRRPILNCLPDFFARPPFNRVQFFNFAFFCSFSQFLQSGSSSPDVANLHYYKRSSSSAFEWPLITSERPFMLPTAGKNSARVEANLECTMDNTVADSSILWLYWILWVAAQLHRTRFMIQRLWVRIQLCGGFNSIIQLLPLYSNLVDV